MEHVSVKGEIKYEKYKEVMQILNLNYLNNANSK